jgi:chromosome segregation and condensation protein ScpB
MNVTVDELGPVTWTPVTDLERTVYAAMILAGRPVTNAELARFMRCSLGEVSKRVKALKGVIRKERIGREVRRSVPSYH